MNRFKGIVLIRPAGWEWDIDSNRNLKWNNAADHARIAYRDERIAAMKELAAKREQEAIEAAKRTELAAKLDELLKAAKFRKQVIKLALPEGSTDSPDMPALVWKGIAVHKGLSANPKYAKYQLTHVRSGLNLGYRLDSQTGAKTLAVRFAAIEDFSELEPKDILANEEICKLARLVRDTAHNAWDTHNPYVMPEKEGE